MLFFLLFYVHTTHTATLTLPNTRQIKVQSWKKRGNQIEFHDQSGECYSIPFEWVTIKQEVQKSRPKPKKKVKKQILTRIYTDLSIPAPKNPIMITTKGLKHFMQNNHEKYVNTCVELENEVTLSAGVVLQRQKKKNDVFKEKLRKMRTEIQELKKNEHSLKRKLFFVRDYSLRGEVKQKLIQLRKSLRDKERVMLKAQKAAIKKGIKIRV